MARRNRRRVLPGILRSHAHLRAGEQMITDQDALYLRELADGIEQMEDKRVSVLHVDGRRVVEELRRIAAGDVPACPRCSSPMSQQPHDCVVEIARRLSLIESAHGISP